MAGVRAGPPLQRAGGNSAESPTSHNRNLPLGSQSQLSRTARRVTRVGTPISRRSGHRPDCSDAGTAAGSHSIGGTVAGRTLWLGLRELSGTNVAADSEHILT